MQSDNGDKDRPSAGRHPRRSRREQSHEEAHALSDAQSQRPLAAHRGASAEPPALVTSAQGLADMIAHLRACGIFAFDSEFIGEMNYIPRLCLVQAATAQKVFLLDPLAGLDLTSFWRLMADPQVEKIVLAGQQDFGAMVQQADLAPANVLDVQIAAGFLQVDYPLSLTRLIQAFVGVELGKGLTFTHWDHRPLSAVQIRYAAGDVRYLPAAREAIVMRLDSLGRLRWAREESAATLESLSNYRPPPPESLYLRVRGHERLSRRELAVLRSLTALRDAAARQQDVPPRTMFKDGVLLDMTRWRPRHVADLEQVKGLPRPFEARYGHRIVEAAAAAMKLPEDQLPPRIPSETPALRDRADRVVAAIDRLCRNQSLAPSLVASRKDVLAACRHLMVRAPGKGHPAADPGAPGPGPSAMKDDDPPKLLRGWRKELLGDLLETLK